MMTSDLSFDSTAQPPVDTSYNPGSVPDVIPYDPTTALLDSQGFMPVGTADVFGDSTGMNSTYSDPTINPNPTGGWQQTLKTVIDAANNAFTTYAKGSPSAATPMPRNPNTSVLNKSYGQVGGISVTGKTLLFVGAGVGLLALLVFYA